MHYQSTRKIYDQVWGKYGKEENERSFGIKATPSLPKNTTKWRLTTLSSLKLILGQWVISLRNSHMAIVAYCIILKSKCLKQKEWFHIYLPRKYQTCIWHWLRHDIGAVTLRLVAETHKVLICNGMTDMNPRAIKEEHSHREREKWL